jgi:3-oxosteroid 1-dehydrogenase
VAARLATTATTLDPIAIAARKSDGVVTMGSALASSLVAGCQQLGVKFRTEVRARRLVIGADGTVGGVDIVDTAGVEMRVLALRGVVVACGRFEWNPAMRLAFLGQPLDNPVSPPWNTGDGVVMGQAVGAALGNMAAAWWVPTYRVSGETYDGQPLAKHLGADLALPGSILVNHSAELFVNEAVNYNDLSAAFAVRGPNNSGLRNTPCWLISMRATRAATRWPGVRRALPRRTGGSPHRPLPNWPTASSWTRSQ